ncbi:MULTISPECIES: hypothetical protein [unclassified Streptomyces]|uniref:hypothetical protein n=1 Tax=unclassified Streptomyces TaxID=2593676 RepID=UPI0036E1F43D
MTKLYVLHTVGAGRPAHQTSAEHEDLRRSPGAEAGAHRGADVLTSQGAIARVLDIPAGGRT